MVQSIRVGIKSTQDKKAGFTLVELSIVLVIIGLIVGGVLVGQEMIRAAEVRSVITQVDKYNTAVNLFQNKYNGLPGDLRNPANFFDAGTGTAMLVTAATLANDNGLIEDDDGSTAGTAATGFNGGIAGENLHFWYQLALANLIENLYTAPATFAVGNSIPLTRLGQCGIAVFTDTRFNYYQVSQFEGATDTANCMTAEDAFSIDTKIDDGNPTRGIILGTNFGDVAADFLNGAAGAADPIAVVAGFYVANATAVVATDTVCMKQGAATPLDDFYAALTDGTNCSLRIRL